METKKIIALLAALFFTFSATCVFFWVITTSLSSRLNVNPGDDFYVYNERGDECKVFRFGVYSFIPLTTRTIAPPENGEGQFTRSVMNPILTLRNNSMTIQVYREPAESKDEHFITASRGENWTQSWYLPQILGRKVSIIKEGCQAEDSFRDKKGPER